MLRNICGILARSLTKSIGAITSSPHIPRLWKSSGILYFNGARSMTFSVSGTSSSLSLVKNGISFSFLNFKIRYIILRYVLKFLYEKFSHKTFPLIEVTANIFHSYPIKRVNSNFSIKIRRRSSMSFPSCNQSFSKESQRN